MADNKKITIEAVDREDIPPVEFITEGYLLIYMKGSKAHMTGELNAKAFAPLILEAIAKKMGG